jgi:3-methylcrotonyl-CoA carboxylase alpha subunit
VTRRFRADLDGDETTLGVSESGDVTFDDGAAPLHVEAVTSASPLTVKVSGADAAGAALRARVAIAGSTAWVFVDGDVFAIELEDAQHERARRRDRSSEGALAAPMPATVSRVLVEAGQQVAAGDTLLLLEAMKMEMPVKAPHAGTVTAIRCQVGELVQPGVPLLEIATEPSGLRSPGASAPG